MKWINTGEREADARRFRLSNFMRKYHLIHAIHLRSRSKLTDFFVFAYFTPHSTDRGPNSNISVGSAINHLTDIRAIW